MNRNWKKYNNELVKEENFTYQLSSLSTEREIFDNAF